MMRSQLQRGLRPFPRRVWYGLILCSVLAMVARQPTVAQGAGQVRSGVPVPAKPVATPVVDAQLARMRADYRAWVATRGNHDLLIEFDPSPDAIDVREPRFSWRVLLEGRARAQSAYQVQVASNERLLLDGRPDMWDSGVVSSTTSIQVSYQGKSLQSNTNYWWRVRVRDESGTWQPFGRTARFTTALFDDSDWTAQWIGRGASDERQGDVDSWSIGRTPDWMKTLEPDTRSPRLRKEFSLESAVVRARLFISGVGLYESHLNGARIGSLQLGPARTDYRRHVLYDSYDVTSLLRVGANAIGVTLGNGWYNPPKKWWGWQMQWFGSPRLIAQLEIECADGSRQRIVSDGTWKAAWGPITFNDVYDGEDYDARLEQTGWDRPGFGERGWSPVNVVPAPGGRLTAARHQPGRVVERIRPLAMRQPVPGVFVFDMGRNFTGWVRMSAQGPPGTKVTLRFAEAAKPDGSLDRTTMSDGRAEDRVILKGGGVETYEPRFTYRGFQFVEVTGYPGVPTPDAIEGRFVYNAVEPAGSFESGSDVIDRIHLCTVQTQRMNLQMGVPTDDTQRPERMGWGADAWLSAPEAMFNLDMPRFYAKWMWDYQDQQGPHGKVSMITPRPGLEEDVVWSAAYILIPWWQYQRTGDRRVLEDHYASLVKYVDFLENQARTNTPPAVEPPRPKWKSGKVRTYLSGGQWGDNLSLVPGWIARADRPLSLPTAFYYQDVVVMGKVAGVLGHDEDARRFADLAGRIREEFNDEFFIASQNSYDDGTQAPTATALALGLVPTGKERDVLQAVLNDIDKHKGRLTTGFIGTRTVIDSLEMMDRSDVAWRLATISGVPGWAEMVRGRTSTTEGWLGGSLSHVALAAPIDAWFYSSLAGIRVDERAPGYANVMIAPYVPKGLDHVSAWVETIRGRVAVSWKQTATTLTVDVTIPANATASVRLPASSPDAVTESGLALASAVGVKDVARQDGFVTVRVGSGHYRFVCGGSR